MITWAVGECVFVVLFRMSKYKNSVSGKQRQIEIKSKICIPKVKYPYIQRKVVSKIEKRMFLIKLWLLMLTTKWEDKSVLDMYLESPCACMLDSYQLWIVHSRNFNKNNVMILFNIYLVYWYIFKALSLWRRTWSLACKNSVILIYFLCLLALSSSKPSLLLLSLFSIVTFMPWWKRGILFLFLNPRLLLF